ncbi:MAG: hypothetical protein QOJ93_1906 [Actinomycetota bacterium]|nr:hypothetical protein [Actinomycetota bacterium]
MEARRDGDYPSLPELRAVLIPGADEDQWDRGELPRAVCHLESQSELRECQVLLQLACVARRSLDETDESRAVALREVLVDLLPRDLDDPCSKVLRVLAGLEPGTSGRGREQRQQVAGSRIGSERQPATSRTVRRFAKQRCWPWLLDRLIEREVQDRKAAAEPVAAPSLAAIHGRLAPLPADVAWTTAVAQILWMPGGEWGDDLLLYHVTPALPQPAEEWGRLEDDVKRRSFLLGIPAVFLSSRARLWRPLWSRLQAATLDVGALDELAAALARDKRLHDRLGSRAVQGLVTERVRLTTELLRGSPPVALRPRLAAIAGDAAMHAGFLCHDQGQWSASRSYYLLAAELAHEAADPLLEAYVLGDWSRKLIAAGDAAGAMTFLERADALAARIPAPMTGAFLAAAEAEAQARLGNAVASLQALERVDWSLDRTDDGGQDPPCLYWLALPGLADQKGRTHMLLGRLGDAEALLATSLSTWDPAFVRDRAIPLVDLASVRIRQGELDESCRLAGEALEVAVATTSPKLVQRVRDLRAELQPWSESSGVRALDEQLATAVWV